MPRKINKADMNIPEQLEAIKATMCDDYCRFREVASMTGETQDWLLYNYCIKCPMNELKTWRKK